MKFGYFPPLPRLARGGLFLFGIVLLINFVSADIDININLGEYFEDLLYEIMFKVPEIFFEFLINVLNAPITILLGIIQNLLTTPVKISMYAEPWGIIVYILSFFYGLLLLFVGFRFIVSGENPEMREKAKVNLKNIIIMMLLVQLSYYLYDLIIQIFSSMTKIIFELIDMDFFLITTGNISNIYLQFVFLVPYIIVLISFIILLSLRYILVASGVLFFAIGIFMYFTGFLKEYGAFIINLLVVAISLPFFYSIVFLASSKVLDVGIFENFKILISLGAFSLVTLISFLALIFVIIKSAMKVISPVMKVASAVNGLI